MDKKEMEKALVEDPCLRRTKENYHEDVLANDPSATGVREYSILNDIPHFHVTENSAHDLTHTVEEGIVKYNLTEAFRHLIYVEKLLTLEQFNERIQSFRFGDEEKVNKPQPITKENLDDRKLKMTAAEIGNLIQNISFIIGDLVPQDNVGWSLILKTVHFFDYCYLPCYENDDIIRWTELISDMHHIYISSFNQHLKPKHHYAIHFPSDTKRIGPLRYARTIR